MLINLERGSVPLGGHASSMGVLPAEFNKRDVPVTFKDGTKGNTCHVATNGQKFSVAQLLGGANPYNGIVLDQISYIDAGGNVQIFDIPEALPVPYKDRENFTLGYVTKLNGLRWGFNFHYESKSGRGQLVKDPGSPIIGACFHFVKM